MYQTTEVDENRYPLIFIFYRGLVDLYPDSVEISSFVTLLLVIDVFELMQCLWNWAMVVETLHVLGEEWKEEISWIIHSRGDLEL